MSDAASPEIWRKILISNHPFVLFENGTAVVLVKPEEDLTAQAIALLKEWGPVHAGSPAGDFSVIHLQKEPGWVVSCHHPDILTYVSPAELGGSDESEVLIGILGRTKRDQDAEELKVVHVEN